MSSIINKTALEKQCIKKYTLMLEQYESIKKGELKIFKNLGEFYSFHGVSRKNFLKYYNRFKNSGGDINQLLPQKRGPKFRTRRPIKYIENKVIELRNIGNNRYDIHNMLKPVLKRHTPSPSGVYNILVRYNLNKLTPVMKKEKRKIITKKAGELAHVDCHYLDSTLVKENKSKLYLVAVVDDCTRITWVEVVEDIKSLTVMFSVLRLINVINDRYTIQFEKVMTDNGPEFGSGRYAKNKDTNPFERMLKELGIKHRYTRPYRPETNGKVERFWKTLKQDMLEDTQYKDMETLKSSLIEYLVYFNEERTHQSLGNTAPYSFRKLLPN